MIITDGPIEANIESSIESKTIIYELVNDDSKNFELTDNKACTISLSNLFNLTSLGSNGMFTLSIRAYIENDVKRENFATIEIPFQINSNPPEWNVQYENIELDDPQPGDVINTNGFYAIDTDQFTTVISYEIINDNGIEDRYEIEYVTVEDQTKINIVLKTVPELDITDVIRIKVSKCFFLAGTLLFQITGLVFSYHLGY